MHMFMDDQNQEHNETRKATVKAKYLDEFFTRKGPRL